jgi:prevent-host-death family protein
MPAPDDTIEVGAFEAKNRLSELLRAAEAGRSVLITRHGRAVARLVPVGEDNAADLAALGAALKNLRAEVGGAVDVRELVEEGRRR